MYLKHALMILLIILLMIGFNNYAFPQAPLKSFDTNDGLVIGLGAALDIGLRLIKTKNKKGSSVRGLRNRSPFENTAINNLSLNAKKGSDVFLLGVAPTGYLASQFVYDDPERSVYLTFESMLITDITNLLAKKLVKRRRPFTYREDIKPDEECHAYNEDHTNANLSFYSGHTSHVATFVFFTNTMLWYYKPEFRSKDWAWIATALIPAVVGYQRVRAGKHFPSDVMVGYLAGAAIGYLVPKMHERDVESGDLTEDFLVGIGTGILAQYLLIKIFGNKNVKNDCFHDTRSNSRWELSPVFGEYSGIRFGLKF